VENPIGLIGSMIRKADQIIQPYQFGDDASKKTALGLPPLIIPSRDVWIAPRIVRGKPRWANQTDSGQNRVGQSRKRGAERARTYPGIAKAIAEQWG